MNHRIFKQHALMRDNNYRFSYFKSRRDNKAELAEAYHFYMNSIHEACLLNQVTRDIVELDIGCHFLSCPDLFFELLEFSILKGEIYV